MQSGGAEKSRMERLIDSLRTRPDTLGPIIVRKGPSQIHREFLESLDPAEKSTSVQLLESVHKHTNNSAITFNDLITAGVCVLHRVVSIGVDDTVPDSNAWLRLRILGLEGEVEVPVESTREATDTWLWQEKAITAFFYAQGVYDEDWHIMLRNSLEDDGSEAERYMKRLVKVPHDLIHNYDSQDYSLSPIVCAARLQRIFEQCADLQFPTMPRWTAELFPGDPGIIPTRSREVTLRHLLAWQFIETGDAVGVRGPTRDLRKPGLLSMRVGRVQADGTISCGDEFTSTDLATAAAEFCRFAGGAVGDGGDFELPRHLKRVKIATKRRGVYSMRVLADSLVKDEFEGLGEPEQSLDQFNAEVSEVNGQVVTGMVGATSSEAASLLLHIGGHKKPVTPPSVQPAVVPPHNPTVTPPAPLPIAPKPAVPPAAPKPPAKRSEPATSVPPPKELSGSPKRNQQESAEAKDPHAAPPKKARVGEQKKGGGQPVASSSQVAPSYATAVSTMEKALADVRILGGRAKTVERERDALQGVQTELEQAKTALQEKETAMQGVQTELEQAKTALQEHETLMQCVQFVLEQAKTTMKGMQTELEQAKTALQEQETAMQGVQTELEQVKAGFLSKGNEVAAAKQALQNMKKEHEMQLEAKLAAQKKSLLDLLRSI